MLHSSYCGIAAKSPPPPEIPRRKPNRSMASPPPPPPPPPSSSCPLPMGGSDDDTEATSDDDVVNLRRLTQSFGATKSDFGSAGGCVDSDSCTDAESSGSDDIAYLRQLKEQFLVPITADASSGPDTPPIAKPIRALPPPDTDEEEDFEILRAIQRRFAHYAGEATPADFSPEINSAASAETSECDPQNIALKNIVMNEEHQGQSHAGLCQAGVEVGNFSMFPAGHFVDLPRAIFESAPVLEPTDTYLRNGTANGEHTEQNGPHLNQAGDVLCTLSVRQFMSSKFPKSVHNFVDALKKNRTCQRFIRDKLMEIEAKIEANKKLKERIKCLMDFHTAYRRKLGHCLCEKKDPRVRLILLKKLKSPNKLKENCKNGSALYFAPEENPQVSNYKMVMRRFPFSLRKKQWSNTEKDNLAKGVKQQYQEMLFLNSMNIGSEFEGSIDSIIMSTFASGDHQVTPEILRSFLPLVNWDRLSSMYLPGRSGPECESRWLNHDDPMINHDPWTLLEDKKLLFTVQERGLYNWIDIAITLGTHRTPFQCLARYQRSLNPHILNREWTNEEDGKLYAAVETFGDNNWQIVASNLDGRTSNQCSVRWRNSLLPARKRVGRWSVEEDKRLKVSVILFGAKSWIKIAQFIPGRTQSQCRERWLNCLDPFLNLESWTEEEDVKLLAAIGEHGHRWSKVAACVPRRTDNQCRRRWKILLPHEVPILKAAQQLKRTVLISNFVGRESERPAIGPCDFTPLMSVPAPDSENHVRIGNKRPRKQSIPGSKMKASSENQRKKTKNKHTRSPEEKSSEKCITTSLADAFARMSLVSSENGSFKRRRKRSSSKPRKSKAKSRSDIEEKSATGVLLNTTAEAASSNLLPPFVNSCVSGGGSPNGTRKNKSRMSRAKSRSELEENSTAGGLVNNSAEVAPSNSYVVGSGRSKGARKNKLSSPRKFKAKSRSDIEENCTAGGLVNNSAEAAPTNLLPPFVKDNGTGSGNSKGTRKNKSRVSQPKRYISQKRSQLDEMLASGELTDDALMKLTLVNVMKLLSRKSRAMHETSKENLTKEARVCQSCVPSCRLSEEKYADESGLTGYMVNGSNITSIENNLPHQQVSDSYACGQGVEDNVAWPNLEQTAVTGMTYTTAAADGMSSKSICSPSRTVNAIHIQSVTGAYLRKTSLPHHNLR